MNKYLIGGALAAAVIAQPALAVTGPKPKTITYSTSTYSLPSWTTAKIFQNFETTQPVPSGGKAYTPQTLNTVYGTITEKVTGSVDLETSGGNEYIQVNSGSSYGLTFSQPMQFFSFVISSFSTTDTVTLTYADLSTRTLTGGEIFGNSVANVVSSTARVNFDMGGLSGIKAVVFKNNNDCNTFLLDNLATAAPEPGTWGMMIVGFGLAGASLRRRRKVRVVYA